MKKFNPWPVGLIAFFAVYILYLVGFIVFSTFHPVDLVADDYYAREIQYQDQIDREQRSLDVRKSIQFRLDPEAKQIFFEIPVEHAKLISEGTVYFYRPSDAKLDARLPLKLDANGDQVIDVGSLKSGLWKIKISWKASNEDYYFERALTL